MKKRNVRICEYVCVWETTTAKSRSVRWPARTHRRGDRGREGWGGGGCTPLWECAGQLAVAVEMLARTLTSAYISYWALQTRRTQSTDIRDLFQNLHEAATNRHPGEDFHFFRPNLSAPGHVYIRSCIQTGSYTLPEWNAVTVPQVWQVHILTMLSLIKQV